MLGRRVNDVNVIARPLIRAGEESHGGTETQRKIKEESPCLCASVANLIPKHEAMYPTVTGCFQHLESATGLQENCKIPHKPLRFSVYSCRVPARRALTLA